MHIKEIVLEGFKSYATRTVIKGWDPQFNAVTGLNGSGKSNILDAICFVLGITNLQHVRASNLQDLVYKRGQAGIQKASVSIIFDNANKDTAPIGYAQFDEIVVTRQVVVGGKNKYLINGHTTQQQVIANLFQSVQLNVNNPHFLIMQGKITKVLNMKPHETLAMVEEAAGTRMFEERKDKAVKTIAKKEKKLEEIQSLLREEILPKLDKLRSERAAYLEFQQLALDLERTERKCIALEYARASQVQASGEEVVGAQEHKLAQIDAQIALYDAEREALQGREADLARSMSGSRYAQLQASASELQTTMARHETQVGLKKRAVDEEKEAVCTLAQRREALMAAVADVEARHAKALREVDRTGTAVEDKAREVVSMQDRILALAEASASGGDAAAAMKKQLSDEQAMLASLAAERDLVATRIKAYDAEIARLEPEIERGASASKALEGEAETAKTQVEEIETRIEDMMAQLDGTDPDAKANELRIRRTEIQRRIAELDRERRDAHASAAHLIDFHYRDPRPGFDRSQVHGPIASLFDVPEEHKNKVNALECGIGGRLQNVVVDSEIAAAELLRNGKLTKRTTFMPLNKVRGQVLSKDALRRARELAPGKCELALNLIQFDPKYQSAMELVFGNTIVCQDAETAKKITFDPRIRTKTVTWAGDTFDPSGTAAGGSRPQSGDRLLFALRYRALGADLARLEATLADTNTQLAAADRSAQDLRQLADQLQLACRRFEHVRGRLEATAGASSLADQLRDVQKSKVDAQARVVDMRAREEALRTRIAELETEIASGSDKDVASQKKQLEQRLKALRKEQSKAEKAHAQAKIDVETVAAEADEVRADVEQAAQAMAEAKKQLAELEIEVKEMTAQLAELKKVHGEAVAELQKLRREQSSFDKDRAQVMAQIKHVTAALSKLEAERKDERARLVQLKREVQAAKEAVVSLESKHPWLTQQSQAAQVQDAAPGEVLGREQAKLRSLRKRHEQLKRNVNVNVMEMIGVAEKREAELQHKLHTVLHDKNKIEETISKLDEIKEDELRKTWTKVNDDFGKIFADLLPGGNTAMLKPVQEDRLLSGLEIRVRLGRMWKDSLTELSGGQRSLIALSLVLALLQFKPAPMYILDEVDAALDLSHTQNIGQLIKSRFTNSQFIIVSLKEGMFSNAHVIFKTRFRDGTSTVEVVKGQPIPSASRGR